MTVETQTTKVFATLNGAATVFSFSPLVIFKSSDLVVTLVDTNGIETVLSEGVGAVNYSVLVSPYPGTGSITYPATGSAANNGKLVMKRVLTLEQTTDLENQGGYFADTQETALDRLMMTHLQQQELIDRSFKFPVSDATAPPDLPTATQRAGKVLAFDSLGNPIAGVLSSVAVNAAMVPLVQSASVAAALAVLNAPSLSGQQVFQTPVLGVNDVTAGAGAGPTLQLIRNKGAGVAGDNLAQVNWYGQNASNLQKVFANIFANLTNVTNTTEASQLVFQTLFGGATQNTLILGKGAVLAGAAGGDKGVGTLNAASLWSNGNLLQLGQFSLLQDSKANTVNGVALTASSWNQRQLTTKFADVQSNVVSLTSNQFVLKAGTYAVFATTAWNCTASSASKLRLRNITAGGTLCQGESGITAANAPGVATLLGWFTITAAQTLELEHWVSGAGCTSGSAASSGEPEIYASVALLRLT